MSDLEKYACSPGRGFVATCYGCTENLIDEIERLTAENELLRAVYEAVMPLKVSGTHLYDCDIALGKAIEALAAKEKQ